jgi:hypothetical protein
MAKLMKQPQIRLRTKPKRNTNKRQNKLDKKLKELVKKLKGLPGASRLVGFIKF